MLLNNFLQNTADESFLLGTVVAQTAISSLLTACPKSCGSVSAQDMRLNLYKASRLAVVPSQHCIQWLLWTLAGGSNKRDVKKIKYPHPVPSLGISESIPPLPQMTPKRAQRQPHVYLCRLNTGADLCPALPIFIKFAKPCLHFSYVTCIRSPLASFLVTSYLYH